MLIVRNGPADGLQVKVEEVLGGDPAYFASCWESLTVKIHDGVFAVRHKGLAISVTLAPIENSRAGVIVVA